MPALSSTSEARSTGRACATSRATYGAVDLGGMGRPGGSGSSSTGGPPAMCTAFGGVGGAPGVGGGVGKCAPAAGPASTRASWSAVIDTVRPLAVARRAMRTRASKVLGCLACHASPPSSSNSGHMSRSSVLGLAWNGLTLSRASRSGAITTTSPVDEFLRISGGRVVLGAPAVTPEGGGRRPVSEMDTSPPATAGR